MSSIHRHYYAEVDVPQGPRQRHGVGCAAVTVPASRTWRAG